MWFDNLLLAIPLWGWFLLLVLAIGFVIFCLRCRRIESDPIKEHMNYYCQCYARGEISRDDFDELKKDLNNYVQCEGKNGPCFPQDSTEHDSE